MLKRTRFAFIYRTREESPNDPKLSDRRSGRGSCAVGLRGAGAVTAEPVRGMKVEKEGFATDGSKGEKGGLFNHENQGNRIKWRGA